MIARQDLSADTLAAVLLEQLNLEMEDEDSNEYLVQILQDDDSYDDLDGLVETIAPFLGDSIQIARQLVDALAAPSSSSSADGQQQQLEKTTIQPASSSWAVAAFSDAPPAGRSEHATKKAAAVSKKQARLERRKQRQGKKSKKNGNTEASSDSSSGSSSDLSGDADDPHSLDTLLNEDDASAWRDCQEQQLVWGGRGRGGRGEYSGAVNSVKSNIHLTNVTVTMDNGLELLTNSTMDIQKGHTYGLIGRNGVGKSTLLKRLVQHKIPGMPHGMRIVLVQQQIEGSDTESSLQALLKADTVRASLLQQQDRLEQQLEADDNADSVLEQIAERLGEIATELDAIQADTIETRALDILQGLQFTQAMIDGPTNSLSGGWRMRLALARALLVANSTDLLLLDECTNHLDLQGLDWLIQHLSNGIEHTIMVVSHDRLFLDAICTDICVLDHQRLTYHPGNYSEYLRQKQEKAAMQAQILDASERQRQKAQAFVQKQQQMANKKNADPNKQRQAKMIKDKKMDRIGNYRDDGKRYKLNSLKQLSENSIRLAQKVHIEVEDPIIQMHFPNPTWPPGIGEKDSIVRLEGFSFRYDKNDSNDLLRNLTLSIDRGSKIALVGVNGSGKSTLAKLIAGDLDKDEHCKKSGSLWKHPNLRLGHVTQYAVEELEEQYADLTVVEYAEQVLRSGKASASVVEKASGNVRQYLGAFGLGGRRHAHLPIGKLSGGERMRLCFATVLAEEPHLLLLDESTNHVDIETLESMSQALNRYRGSVLMVSHNQSFLSGFCNELWVVSKGGSVTVNHSDTETFDEIFSDYRTSVMTNLSGGGTLTQARQQRAIMAKKATQQRQGARQNTALL